MSDIFVGDEKKVIKKEKSKGIPKSYLPIKLSSNGQLGYPSKIHVRNYSGQDALDLAMSTEDTILESLLTVLNNMIYEDVDASTLHEQDIEEIMLNIYFNFWQDYLEYPYMPTEEELKTVSKKRQDALSTGGEKLVVSIRTSQIKTKMLSSLNTPITITDESDGRTYGFILPRIGQTLIAKELTEDKFIEEEDEYSELEQQLKHNEFLMEQGKPLDYKISPSKMRKFKKYQIERLKFFARQQQIQLISQIDEVDVSAEEAIEEYSTIPLTVWKDYNTYLKDNVKFGIEHEIKVKSPLTGEDITRSFLFRFMDFLPSMDP